MKSLASTTGILACFVLTTAVSLRAQDTLYFPPSDRVAVRVMRAIPTVDVAPGVHVRTVVGTTGAFSLADFDSAAVAPLHHHSREQADIGIAGRFDMMLGSRIETLGPGSGVIVPPNVEHSIANRRGGVMTVIEFHAVPRPDLVPPRPAMSYPSSAEPARIPDDRKLVTKLDVGKNAGLTGETCTAQMRRITSVSVDLHPAVTRTEHYLYVVRGDAELTVQGMTMPLSAGMLVIVPPTLLHASVRARGTGDVALAEFSRR